MSDKRTKEPPRRRDTEGGPGGPLLRPPVKMLLLWAVVIFAIPLFLVLFNGRDTTQLRELRQSDFEDLLKRRLIQKVTIEEQQSSGAMIVLEGTYWPTEDVRNSWQKRSGLLQRKRPEAQTDGKASGKDATKDDKSGFVQEPMVIRFKCRVVYSDILDQMIREYCAVRETRFSNGLWMN
ncbi:MAG: ATP-dependent metallopeptidase FtsH/Yme1/Tma family protein, partial [Victivallales bacterium]|nr:ATP-dependent metallopeptidase FtsH/Yme1/Tma family protein [Victivallales bacterium]